MLQGVPLSRSLVCVTDPVRYCSHAVRAFIREMFGFTVETSAIGCLLPARVQHNKPTVLECAHIMSFQTLTIKQAPSSQV